MKFKEAYGLYSQNVDIRIPFCGEHKTNLFDDFTDLNNDPEINRTRFEYYVLYLESCGEIDRPRKPFICYDIYIRFYAEIFERDLRRNLMSKHPEVNAMQCRLFNIPPRYNGMMFETIKDYPEQKQIIQTAKNWINNGYKESLLLGSYVPGVGKTNTLVCTGMQRYVDFDLVELKRFEGALEFLNSSIIFIKERQLISILNTPGIYRGMILDRLAKAEYLMYDDMFSVADKEFTRTALMDLFDNRIDSEGKPTAITTRMELKTLKNEFPDLYSRLSRGVIYYSDSKRDLRRNG